MAISIDTKPNLTGCKFEQCVGDSLVLSGCTDIHGTFQVSSGGTLSILPNRGSGKVLTSDASGNATWQTPAAGGISTANNGLNVIGTNVRLGGALTGNTTITGAYTLNICNNAQLNTACGYQISGTTILCTSPKSISNVFLGQSAGNKTTTGTNNIGVGYGALSANTSGCNNFASGYNALGKNTTGINNFSIGYQALCSNTSGGYNVAIGTNALNKNTTSSSNIAIGYHALYSNTTTGSNVAIGTQALSNNQSGSCNIALGFDALSYNNTGCNNFAGGYQALYGNSTGNNNVGIGYKALYYNGVGTNNIAIGYQANYCGMDACNNIANGYQALYYNKRGTNNIANGYQALYCNTYGYNNIANGYLALYNNDGVDNTAIGCKTLWSNTTGGNNIALGCGAGHSNTTGSYSIFIGANAGFNETNSNRLHIANNATSSLIYGEFNNKLLKINGTLVVTGNTCLTGLPAQSTETCVVYIDSNGKLAKGTVSGGLTTANNGLNVIGTNVRLGGALTGNTTIGNGSCVLGINVSSFDITAPVKVCTTPTSGLNTDGILVWNSSDKCIKQISTASILSCAITGATNGLTKVGQQVKLGGALTGDTTITGAYTLNMCNGAKLNTTCGYQVSGNTVLRTAPNNIGSIYLGRLAGTTGSTGGQCDIAIGNQALTKLICNGGTYGNIAIGLCSQLNTVAGWSNIAIGSYSMMNATDGAYNIGIGENALACNCNTYNVALGYQAMQNNSYGDYNVGIGYRALTLSTCGRHNVAIGSCAGCSIQNGENNVMIGSSAGINTTTGDINVFIGNNAGYSNVSGVRNIFLGNFAGYNETNSDRLYIANNATSPLIYGEFNNKLAKINGTFIVTGNTCLTGLPAKSSETCVVYIDSNGKLAKGTVAAGGIGWSNLTYGSTVAGCGTIASGSSCNNTFYGVYAGKSMTIGTGNIAVGTNALCTNCSGNYNIAIGQSAMYNNLTGNDNIANGLLTLFCNTTGCNNIALGTTALYYNTGGNNNVALGCAALYCNTGGTNNFASGYQALYCNTSGSNNIGIGYFALLNNSTGANNIANGYQALVNNLTGSDNIANGYQALVNNTTGINNIANGFRSLFNNTTGCNNIANGNSALFSNIGGSGNFAAGCCALYSNCSGSNNIANGTYALFFNTTGSYNVANGYQALIRNQTGSCNIASGYMALCYNIFGCNNIGLGYQSGFQNTCGHNNIGLGYQAGYSNSIGCNSVFIGKCAGYSETASNRLHIANNATSSLIYGEFDNKLVRIGGALRVTGNTCLTGLPAKTTETNVVYIDTAGKLSSGATSSGGGSISITQASHGFVAGNIIRVCGTNVFAKAQADSGANAEVVGYVTECVDANNFKYVTQGIVTTGVPVATGGTVYFLDSTTAGTLTATEPSTAGQVSKPLLVVIESGAKAAFNNFRGMQITNTGTFVPTTRTVNGKSLSTDITLYVDSSDFTFSDNTTNNSSASKHGLLPKLSGSQSDALRGDGTWGAVSSGSAFWTTVQGTPTRTSNTTFTLTGDYTGIFAKGLVIKWTESSSVRMGMVSIPSTYSAPNTTVTIIGDTMASIDSTSLKYSLTGAEVFIARFNVSGNISANGTDVANAYYSNQPMHVFGADLQVGVAGVTNNTTIDINKNGTTMFTTKPTLASTVAYSSTPFSANNNTELALNDKVTIDIDAYQTTPAIDLYVQLYLYPTRYLNLV